MRITRVEANKLAFKSLRTDKNRVAQLKTGEKPLIENNKINIKDKRRKFDRYVWWSYRGN